MGLRSFLSSFFDQGLAADEKVTFYPSIGFHGKDGWKLQIRGLVYEDRGILQEIPALALQLLDLPSGGELEDLLDGEANQADAIAIFKKR